MSDLKASRRTLPAFVAIGMVWAALSAQVPVLKEQIDASDAQMGLALLIASIGAIGAMWLAPLFDRKLGAASIQVGTILMALSFLVPGVTGSITVFALALLLASAGSGIADVLVNARLAAIESGRPRPLMNLNHAMFSFAYAFTAVLTGIAREAGWTPFAIFASVTGVILLMVPLMHLPAEQTSKVEDQTSAAAPVGIVWMGGLVVMAAFFTESAAEGWSALHIERGMGGGAAAGAFGPAVLGLTMGIGRMFGQSIAAKVPETKMITVACLISAVGMGLAAATNTIWVAYLGFGIAGIGISVVAPVAMTLIGRLVSPSARVGAISKASAIGFCAFFVGPAVMGLTSEYFGLPMSFLMVAAILVAVAGVLVPMLSRRIGP